VPGIQAPVLLIEGSIATLSAGCLHNSTLSWSGCMVALQSDVKHGGFPTEYWQYCLHISIHCRHGTVTTLMHIFISNNKLEHKIQVMMNHGMKDAA
jgi:hypothetical protein